MRKNETARAKILNDNSHKFCLYIYTKNHSVMGYFTGFYTHQGDKYVGAVEDINDDKVKFFTVEHTNDKAEKLHNDFFSRGDIITICDYYNRKVSSYDGISWWNHKE